MNLSEVVNDHWSKPLVDSMLTTNTYVGKYMKQALIEYMQFISYELKNIDMFISDISKTILIPENLNMELQLCLLNEDVRKKYVFSF